MPHRPRTPTVTRTSKSAAVRHALLHPSARQLSRMQRQRLQRRLIWGTAAALALIVIAVLGFGYWRENVARGAELAADVHGTRFTLNELVPYVKPRAAGYLQALAFYQSQGDASQAQQLQFQLI